MKSLSHSPTEQRCQMKTRDGKIEDGGLAARSILECGDLSLLLGRADVWSNLKCRQVGALQGLTRVCSALVLLLLSTVAVHAQTYSIDWFTVDGGGGTSTG